MSILKPFNLHRWIEQNRGLLKPPVGNKLLFEDSELIVMAVGGPNCRKDFHHDPGEEFFYQLQGKMLLKIVQDGQLTNISIAEGDVFLLPAEVPHSPERYSNTVGIVVERKREPGELDGFSWYCESCGHCLYLERIAVQNLESQLPQIFANFYGDSVRRTCTHCGTIMQPPGAQ